MAKAVSSFKGLLIVGVVFCCANSTNLTAIQTSSLSTAAEVAGIVVDDSDRPLAEAKVSLRRRDEISNDECTAVSDEKGRFSCSNLRAGWHVVSVSRSGFAPVEFGATNHLGLGRPIVLEAGEKLNDLTVRMQRIGVVAGTVRRTNGEPFIGAAVSVLEERVADNGSSLYALAGYSSVDDRGMYRVAGLPSGRYLVRATPVERAPNPDGSVYAPTYAPGVTSAALAEATLLGAGEEEHVDIVVALSKTFELKGRVTDPAGTAVVLLPGDVKLYSAGIDASIPAVGLSETRGNTFRFRGLLPGDYVLQTASVVGNRSGQRFSARTTVTIAGNDIESLSISLRPSATVYGRVSFSGEGPRPDLSTLRVSLQPPAEFGTSAQISSAARVALDGAFLISDIIAGRYHLSVKAVPGAEQAWLVDELIADGREQSDGAVEAREGQPVSVGIKLTDRLGEITGRLVDRTGQASSTCAVIAFPLDRELWSPPSRRIVATRPAQTGQFLITGLPPGRYRLAAVVDPQRNVWLLPGFLDAIVANSVVVEVSRRSTTEQDLSIAGSAEERDYAVRPQRQPGGKATRGVRQQDPN